LEVDNRAALLHCFRFYLWFLDACDIGDQCPGFAHEGGTLPGIRVFDRHEGRFEETEARFLGIESWLRFVCLFLLRQRQTPPKPFI
jgi:hypothetical protein